MSGIEFDAAEELAETATELDSVEVELEIAVTGVELDVVE